PVSHPPRSQRWSVVRHALGLDALVVFVVFVVLVILVVVFVILLVLVVLGVALAGVEPEELLEFVAAGEILGDGCNPHGGPFGFLVPGAQKDAYGGNAQHRIGPDMIVKIYSGNTGFCLL